jgi:hypothetical protein
MQYFLQHIGITKSYLFLNTFVYPIFGQYGATLRWLAQHPDSPIVRHRQTLLNYAADRNGLRLVVAVGVAAKETVATWIESCGGTCPDGPADLSSAAAAGIGANTHFIGVRHPGGAGQGGSVAAIIEDFKEAIRQIDRWATEDPAWLPPDPGASRQPASEYRYRSAPIPFRDLPFGVAWRVGRGGTSSNRGDSQRSIQIFSAGGRYSTRVNYSSSAEGSQDGYLQPTGDLPYEPPRADYSDFDRGPGAAMARLLMGGEPSLDWPDFTALGIHAHPSFGYGPIYRGRFTGVKVLVLADQESHDDLFTCRALTGDGGQRLQAFLAAAGITRSYLILRVLPVDTLGLPAGTVRAAVDHAGVRSMYSAIVERVAENNNLLLALAVGPNAQRLAPHVLPSDVPVIPMKAWRQSGSLANWRAALNEMRDHLTSPDEGNPVFIYNGERGQIPRADLPFGTLRWQGTSGDRAAISSAPAPDYYKFFMPRWAFQLPPEPLSTAEQSALERAP